MTMLREQRPPTSDRKPGARSNRPNSTSALSSYDLWRHTRVWRGGIDDQLTRSIDDLFGVKSRENSARSATKLLLECL